MFSSTYFLVVFYLGYTFVSVAGYFFIDQRCFSLYAVLLFITAFLSITIASYFGQKSKPFIFKICTVRKINDKWYILCYLFLLVFIIFSWILNINYWGLSIIFEQANVVRDEVIGGNGVIPASIGYINALNHAFFTIVVVKAFVTKKNLFKVLVVLCILNILAIDLISFGRIGVVYAVFILVAAAIYFNPLILINKKSIVGLIFLLIIISVPRLIRGAGDNFDSTISKYSSTFIYKPPEYLNVLVSTYFYYFTSPVAFSELIENQSGYNNTYGYRFFSPIYNIYYKINNEDRPNTIDKPVYVPYETNIFSILKDIMTDFGWIGFFIVPSIFGFFLGMYSKIDKCKIQYLTVYMLAIVLFSPLYNPLSFGSFFISFVFLFINTMIHNEEG